MRLVQRDTTVGTYSVFAQSRSCAAGSVEYDKDLASLWGDFDAKSWKATVPIDDVFTGRRERVNRALG